MDNETQFNKTRLTQKQETFCLKYFELGNASEAARLAKYSIKTAAVIGRENLLKPKIQHRLQELNQRVEDESVADVLERKQILTEIARARLPDYITCGPDGDLIDVGSESPNTSAFQEITSRTEFDKDGSGVAVITKLKLHNSITAIDTLNKMDKIYTENTVNIDNRKVEIIVDSEAAKQLTEKILKGENT